MVLAVAVSYGQTRPGSFKGTVKDKRTGEVIPFATVIVKDKDVVIATGTTDFDGKYNINPINAGVYNLTCKFIGYADFNLNGVTVYSGKPKVVNFDMTVESTVITEVTVIAKEDLIETGKTSDIVSSEEIKNLPYRNLSQIVGTTAGVFQQDGSGSFNVRGSRSSTNVIFIDGVKVRGDVNLPRDAILQTEVITGGVPAQYGDVTGGVISTTTKGPAPYYFGSSEILTSSAFDPYHYNLGALTLGGPIIRNKKTGQPIVGFLLASEFQYNRDGSPRSLTTWKVNDDKLAELEANPLVPASSGFGVLNAADFLTQADLEDQNYRENVARTAVRVSGNLKFVTSEKTTLTLGGRYNMNQGRNGSRFNELMNYGNNSESFSQDWSTYVRFQQRFGNPSDTSNSLIRNAFYTIQMDFTRNERLSQDARHKDNLFAYGHIGNYKTTYRPLYVLGSDTITDPNDPNYGKVMDAYTLAVYQSIGVDFTPGQNNPILSNYTSNFYDFVDQNLIFNRARSLEDIRAGGGLLNGDQPSSVYGLWGNVGANQASYGKTLNDQFRITASSTFDIKDHSLIVGVEYEQRFDRSYSIGARGLWTLMRLIQNDAIRELDLNNPVASYNNGVFQDTLNYPRLFDADKPRTFDRELRKKLNLDPNGTDWLDIDSYDPSTFSLDMFSANELLNIGSSQYVSYFGFDYLGNRLTTRPSLNDFFATDAQGNSQRLVGAFEPIYMAGYIQDQFTFEDLFFNIGVRVDRFDANQPVLADPYVLYPVYTVGDLGATALAGYDVPQGMSDDAVVYVDDQENPSSIVGYREGNTWFTAAGEVEANPKNIADKSGGIKPFLINPGIEDQKLAVTANESFKDYTPQVTVSPRISFQFPISDEAEFFAHYDIMVQRPDPGVNRMNPITYLQLENGDNGNLLANPDLRPQRTTDYEIGFRQKLGENSALKISAFYREMRDMMQSFSFTEAYPVTYIAFGNLDFGTVKGYTMQYDLRRTGNVRLNANYTLQFADGTGSSSTSGANIARSGQPNLRYILPLTFDSRHQVVMNMDYRYGGGAAYNGPVWFGKRVLENAGLNVVLNANSGTPYTRRSLAYGLTDGVTPITGNINGSRLPWSFRIDATANKMWNFNEGPFSNFEIYAQLLNVLNTQNTLGVYSYTGSPSDDG